MPQFISRSIFWPLLAFLCAGLTLCLDVPAANSAAIDLHAHFFMPEGSGFPFFGDFYEPLRATNWSSRLKTRVNAESLEKSDVKIAVVALYSHPLFWNSIRGSQRETIRTQVQAVTEFLAHHPQWALARDSRQARAALLNGKRVLILSIEGASGIIESESDIHEFVDQLGVAIVTPLHFLDDEIGGAGFMPGLKAFVNPLSALASVLNPLRDESGVRINRNGLTRKGKTLIASLIAHHVWLDFSHSSDRSVEEMLPLLGPRPLLYTHAILREAFRGERGIAENALKTVLASGGIVGVLPSDDMLEGTSVDPRFCPSECASVCEGGRAAFASQYQKIASIVSVSHTVVGSDIDAPLTFLKPECEAVRRENPNGVWSYAQLGEVSTYLRKTGLTSATTDDDQIHAFLDAWERVTTPQ